METTVSKEDYLKAIAEIASEGEPVIPATLGRWLDVTPAAVTMALRRLQKDGLAAMTTGGLVQLTRPGAEIARRIRFRHHLVERMLSEMFGMPWYKVHDEAERLEHAVSSDFEALLIDRLGSSGICPHGNNIRSDSAAERRSRGLVPLAEAPAGMAARVCCIFERDRALLEYLDGLGVCPGAAIRVVSRNPDSTLSLQVGEEVCHLGSQAAQRIWIGPATLQG